MLPIHKQQTGASWCKSQSHSHARPRRLNPGTDSRLAAFGNVLGYSIGSLDLVSIFGPSFGDTQFKKLSLVATFTILFTCGVTCWAVSEKVLEPRKGDSGKDGVGAAVRTIVRTLRNLPPRVQAICWAHFWSWIGEFPRASSPDHFSSRILPAHETKAGSLSTSTAPPGSVRPTSATMCPLPSVPQPMRSARSAASEAPRSLYTPPFS